MRHILLWMARNRWLKEHLPRLPFARRAVRRFMPGEMVGMSVRDEGAGLRIPWIQPQVELRQMQASLKTNFNQAGGRLERVGRLRQGKGLWMANGR